MNASAVVSVSKEIWASRKHPIASDAGVLAVSQYAGAAIGVLTTVATARLLGPTDYGMAALVMSYPSLLLSFMSSKPASVTTRYIVAFRASGQTQELRSICKLGYGLDLLASSSSFLLTVFTGWWVARYFYHMPDVSWLMVAYAASFPVWSLTWTSSSILVSWQKFRWVAILQILEKGTTFLCVVGFLLAGLGVPGVIFGTMASQVGIGLAMLGASTYTLRREGYGFWWRASLRNLASLRKELSAFFGWNYLVVTFSGLVGHIPLMLLGHLRGPEEAGFYRLATALATVGSYVETSLGKVVYPILSASWVAERGENIHRTLKRWTLRAGLPAGAVLLFAIPVLPVLVPSVFGSGYRPMVLGAQIMMAEAALSATFFWLNAFYYASGQVGHWTKAYGLYTTAVVGLAWFSIERWGFLGMAGLATLGRVTFITLMAALVAAAQGRPERGT